MHLTNYRGTMGSQFLMWHRSRSSIVAILDHIICIWSPYYSFSQIRLYLNLTFWCIPCTQITATPGGLWFVLERELPDVTIIGQILTVYVGTNCKDRAPGSRGKGAKRCWCFFSPSIARCGRLTGRGRSALFTDKLCFQRKQQNDGYQWWFAIKNHWSRQ